MSTVENTMIDVGKVVDKTMNLYGDPGVLNVPPCTYDFPPHLS